MLITPSERRRMKQVLPLFSSTSPHAISIAYLRYGAVVRVTVVAHRSESRNPNFDGHGRMTSPEPVLSIYPIEQTDRVAKVLPFSSNRRNVIDHGEPRSVIGESEDCMTSEPRQLENFSSPHPVRDQCGQWLTTCSGGNLQTARQDNLSKAHLRSRGKR
jgi:hypothetical protein